MSRPLIISDCDGVLLNFCDAFIAYLDSEHDLVLKLESFALSGNIRDKAGELVAPARFPALLDGFFRTHMATQVPIDGAVPALAHAGAGLRHRHPDQHRRRPCHCPHPRTGARSACPIASSATRGRRASRFAPFWRSFSRRPPSSSTICRRTTVRPRPSCRMSIACTWSPKQPLRQLIPRRARCPCPHR